MSTRRKLQRQHKKLNPRLSLAELPVVPAGREEEADAVMMLNMAWSGLDKTPSCAGPILVHQDGHFECHGDCHGDEGRSAMSRWHDLDLAVWPCNATERPPVDEVVAPCPGCP